MNTVFNLIIIDLELSNDDYKEEFNIGFFSAYQKAVNIAEKYLNEADGFNRYNCDYKITQKTVADFENNRDYDTVYIIYGWNTNSDFDEINIIESDCFVTYKLAVQELNNMKEKYIREEWCLNKYRLDECEWRDGFFRL